MNFLETHCGRTIVAINFFFIAAGTLQAGGLVDTSAERFMDTEFSDSANITNPWWSLPAGANFLYFAEDDGECAWNLMQVLNEGGDLPADEGTTSEFGGVYAGTEARIILDREWIDGDCDYESDPANFAAVVAAAGDPEETTYDWYAQDDDGNIWYMGEDTRDSEGDSAGSFVAGCDVAGLGIDAEAGLVMLADPRKGDFYSQEFYAGEAEDWGKVLNFVGIDEYVCLKTKEWTPLTPGHNEHKFYCSDGVEGVLMMVDELKGKTVKVEFIGSVGPGDMPAAPSEDPGPVPTCP